MPVLKKSTGIFFSTFLENGMKFQIHFIIAYNLCSGNCLKDAGDGEKTASADKTNNCNSKPNEIINVLKNN